MRIAILTNDDPHTSRGGAGRVVMIQEKVLRDLGHEVRVFCPPIPWLQSSVLLRLVGHVFDLGSRKEVVTDVSNFQPDILISHNLTGCGFGTPKKIGVRWIHILHDVQLFAPSGHLRDARRVTLLERCVSLARRLFVGTPSLVISPTQWLLDQHLRRGFFKDLISDVVPNPTAQTFNVQRSTLRAPTRLLFVGRLSIDKGADLLIDLASDSSLEIHMIGDGPLKSKFSILNSNFFYHGPQPSDQVQHWMKECDVLLVPSRIEENQPMVIIEATGVGLPVLAATKGGIPDTLGHHPLMCVASDKKEDWIYALKKIQEPATYQACVDFMQNLAEKHQIKNYQEHWEKILKT